MGKLRINLASSTTSSSTSGRQWYAVVDRRLGNFLPRYNPLPIPTCNGFQRLPMASAPSHLITLLSSSTVFQRPPTRELAPQPHSPACCVISGRLQTWHHFPACDAMLQVGSSLDSHSHAHAHAHAPKKVKLDVRIVGDRYYDPKWASDMLARRVRGAVPNSSAWALEPHDHLFR